MGKGLTRISLSSVSGEGSRNPLELEVASCFALGYTGRDRASVERHIKELEEHGVAAPARVPTCFPVLTGLLLMSGSEVQVYGHETSGEIEPVLIVQDGRPMYVGVGSDHTDRAIERHSIPHAKQLGPKVLSTEVWNFKDAAERWDNLVIRSFSDGALYQEATLASMLPPLELIEIIPEPARAGTSIVLCGTVPLKTSLRFGADFSGELEDRAGRRSLHLEYQIHVLEPII